MATATECKAKWAETEKKKYNLQLILEAKSEAPLKIGTKNRQKVSQAHEFDSLLRCDKAPMAAFLVQLALQVVGIGGWSSRSSWRFLREN